MFDPATLRDLAWNYGLPLFLLVVSLWLVQRLVRRARADALLPPLPPSPAPPPPPAATVTSLDPGPWSPWIYAGIYLAIAVNLLGRRYVAADGLTSLRLLDLLGLVPLLGFAALRAALRARLEVTPQGVTRGSLGRRRSLGWAEVRQVVYKPGGIVRGYRISDKTILRGDAGRVVITSSTGDHAAVEAALLAHLWAHGIDYDLIKRTALASWRGRIATSHVEDAVEGTLGLLLLFASIWWAARLAVL